MENNAKVNNHRALANAQTSGSSVDVDELVQRSSCAKEYTALEECLADNNRDWRKCQSFVKAMKICNDQLASSQKKGTN